MNAGWNTNALGYLLWAPMAIGYAVVWVSLGIVVVRAIAKRLRASGEARDRRLGLWGLAFLAASLAQLGPSFGVPWAQWAWPAALSTVMLVVPFGRVSVRSLSRAVGATALALLCLGTLAWLAYWRSLGDWLWQPLEVRLLGLQAMLWGLVAVTELRRCLRTCRMLARLQVAARAGTYRRARRSPATPRGQTGR